MGGATVTTTGVGGGAGGDPIDCDLGVLGACGEAQKCSIVDTLTGEHGCVTAGSLPAFSGCVDDAECEDGTWCDLRTRVCKPFCESPATCNGGVCLAATTDQTGATPIPNAFVCTAHCDPETVEPCAPNGVTCHPFLTDPAYSDCVVEGSKGAEDTCDPSAFPPECAKKMYCDPRVNRCLPWCTPTNSFCSNGREFCFSTGISYEGKDLGVCD